MNFKSLLLIGAVLLSSLHAESGASRLSELNVASFTERQKAHDALVKWLESDPDKASAALFKYRARSKSPEVRSRIRCIVSESQAFRRHVIAAKYGQAKGFVGVGMRASILVRDGKSYGVVTVTSVHPGSPADLHGVLRGDSIWGVDEVVFKANGKLAQEKFSEYVAKKNPGDVVSLKFFRGEKLLDVSVTLATRYFYLSKLGNSMRYDKKSQEESDLAQVKMRYYELWLREKLKE